MNQTASRREDQDCGLPCAGNSKSGTHIAFKAIMAIMALLLATAIAALLHPTSALAKAADEDSGNAGTVTISAAGDCTLGIDSRYNGNFNSYFKRNGASYFLRNVKKVFAKDDITVVNFEGTLTNAGTRAIKTFTFKGPAAHSNILTTSSVEVVGLANNHSMDFGSRGFADTKRTLTAKGIAWAYKAKIAYKKANGVKVAFLSFNDLDSLSYGNIKTGISRAKGNGAKIVVVSFHWGIEREYRPNARQKSLGRYAIDCGASVVLGHHPHVLQGIEKYKGRYIVYSLGNFCFGGNTNPQDKDTMIFQQTFKVKNGKLAKGTSAKVIPCSLSGKTYTNDYQPKVLSGASRSRVVSKLNRISSGMHTRVGAGGVLS